MKSVILCEGPDDLWFVAYYLYKRAKWEKCSAPKDIWSNYEVAALNHRQQVEYLRKGEDSVAIWAVGGKDSFQKPISVLFDKFIKNFPFDPIDSIVIMRDRDNDSIEASLLQVEKWFSNTIQFANKQPTTFQSEIDNYEVKILITPVIIPFFEEGAIETLLMNSISEDGNEGNTVVENAKKYISSLAQTTEIRKKYLSHERLLLKAKYAATVAVTNPGHSTGIFQNLVMSCPWETSEYVKKHFDIILDAITTTTDK